VGRDSYQSSYGDAAESFVRTVGRIGTVKEQSMTKAQLISELKRLRRRTAQRARPKPKRGSTNFPQSLEWQNAIFEGSRDAIFIADSNDRFVAVNTAACTLTGYQREELLKMRIPDLHEEADLGAYKRFRDRIHAGESILSEARIKRKDGSQVDTEFSNSCVVIGGDPFMCATARDITDRNRAEELLRQSKDKFLKVFHANPVLMALTRLSDGTIVDANAAFLECLGYQPEEVIGRRSTEIGVWVDPLDREKMLSMMNMQEPANPVEISFRHKSGEIVPVLASVAPITISGEEYLLGISVDIAERKRAELSLRTKEQELSNAMKIAHLGHWEYDVASDLFTFNDQFYSIFRTTAHHAGGYTMSSAQYAQRFVHPDDRALVGSEIQKAMETSDPQYSRQVEHRIIYADGAVGHLAVRFFVVKDAQGRTVKTYGVNQDITDRKRAVEALQESEERFRTLFEQAAVGVALLETKTGRYVRVNQKYCEFLGYSVEEMLQKTFQDLTSPEDIQTNRDNNAALIAGRIKEFSLVKRYIRKDGTVVWGHLTASPLWKPGTTPNTYFHIAVVEDISERKRIEEELVESELKYRSLFETMTEGVALHELIVDDRGVPVDYRIVKVNKGFERIVGISREEAVGVLASRLYGTGVAPYLQEYAKVVRSREPIAFETHFESMGKDFAISVVSPKPGEFATIFTDITERKKSGDRLLLLAHTIRSISECVSITDLEDNILFVNEAFLKTYGYAVDELIRKPIAIVRPQGSNPEMELIRSSTITGTWKGEVVNRRKDGTEFPIALSTSVVSDEKGNPVALVGVATDISERMRSETALSEAKNRLTILSHRLLETQENERRAIARELHDEVGQILTATKIDLQVIRRDEALGNFALRLDDDITVLDECLHRVRDISLDLRPSVLDDLGIVAALGWQLERLQNRAGFQGHLTTENVPEKLDPDIQTACFRIAQEALTNVAKHAKAKKVNMDLRKRNEELVLVIHDDGIGFGSAEAMSGAIHGKSFGLLGMQERASLMGGNLEVSSSSGNGTTITVHLPLRSQHQQ
jgi:PAS domain S-box-containing protein